jgi:hypothetical protein
MDARKRAYDPRIIFFAKLSLGIRWIAGSSVKAGNDTNSDFATFNPGYILAMARLPRRC